MSELRIRGRVHRSAEFGMNRSGHYTLLVLVTDEASDKLYLAERDFGAGAAASIACEAAALRLRTNTPVTLMGSGLRDHRWRGQWVRRLAECTHIEPPIPSPRCERAEAPAA